jgi:tRNA dimethylallyltransferase
MSASVLEDGDTSSTILIAGPTASGKSALALALAQKHNGVIINADSMQVYRDLRILTARPTPEDEASVPHSLFGMVDGAEAYSVGHWLEAVDGAITGADADGRTAIVVGGTGLYFKALLGGLSPMPDVPADVRAYWRLQGEQLSGAELHAALTARDPHMAERLRPSDGQRLVRALEVVEATGRSLADWQSEPGRPLIDAAQVRCLVVNPPREDVYQRIEVRFERMIEAGALDEVAALRDRQLSSALPVMRALGVSALLSHLNGACELEAAIERCKTETRRYAKRQFTWLRGHMQSWDWLSMQQIERLGG